MLINGGLTLFLHIGAEKEIEMNKILCILDYTSFNQSIINRTFCEHKKQSERVFNDSEEHPKSIVVLHDGEDIILYLSPITSNTLHKRMALIEEMGNRSVKL